MTVPLVPRQVLFGNPEKAGGRISPDGKWLSWIAPRDGVLNVWVAPRDQLEFMAEMEQGDVLLYTWEAGGTLYYDFHAHPEGGHPDYWSRYAEGKAGTDSGSLVAPYTGEHGWLWLNSGSEPVTVRLTVSGYYRQVNRTD